MLFCNLFLYSGFTLIFVVNSLMIQYEYFSSEFSKYVGILGVITATCLICGMLLKIPISIDAGHFLFSIYLFTSSLIAENPYLILVSAITLLIVILSRCYFSGCLLKRLHKERTVLKPPLFRMILKQINWNIVYPGLLLIALYRYYSIINPGEY